METSRRQWCVIITEGSKRGRELRKRGKVLSKCCGRARKKKKKQFVREKRWKGVSGRIRQKGDSGGGVELFQGGGDSREKEGMGWYWKRGVARRNLPCTENGSM